MGSRFSERPFTWGSLRSSGGSTTRPLSDTQMGSGEEDGRPKEKTRGVRVRSLEFTTPVVSSDLNQSTDRMFSRKTRS